MPKKFRNDKNAVLDTIVSDFLSRKKEVDKETPVPFGAEGFDRRKKVNPGDRVGEALKHLGIRQKTLRDE